MNSVILGIRNFRNHLMRILSEVSSNVCRPEIAPELCIPLNANLPSSSVQKSDPLSILGDIIDNGFLWAVPKKRRSLERRLMRRMGFGKMILPKKNIVVCEACGHFHLVHTVCGNCYEKVKEETILMQDAVLKELKLDPIEQEVVVLYENDQKENEYIQGKRIVELPKQRPQWFSKNLLAKDSETVREKRKSVGTHQITPTIQDS